MSTELESLNEDLTLLENTLDLIRPLMAKLFRSNMIAVSAALGVAVDHLGRVEQEVRLTWAQALRADMSAKKASSGKET